MGIIVLQRSEKLNNKNLQIAKEEYGSFIKITIDLKNELIALGGEYHADAETVLIKQYQSESINIVGGGYHLERKEFLTNAMINLRPNMGNNSMEILDSQKREKFLKLAAEIFDNKI